MHKMNNETVSQYRNRFAKESYDRLNIQVPKGQKENIMEYAKSKGFTSLNAYVNSLIVKDMSGGGQE